MYKNDEVLSFSLYIRKTGSIKILKKLEHFDKAPYGMKDEPDEEQLRMKLLRFVNKRAIPSTRPGYEDILKATHCKNGSELSFKGHGLSLSNHYWYKREGEDLRYEDINFFTNKWDDSFGRALIYEDYEALEKADLNVPDIVTSGWALKGWIYDDGPKLYKLGIAKGHSEESISEVLVSQLARRLCDGNEVLKYELKQLDNGRYASVSEAMIGIDEELIPLSAVLSREFNSLYLNRNTNRNNIRLLLEKLKTCGFPELSTFFVKVFTLRCLCFLSDLHLDNLSMIKDNKTNKLRPAPIFDLAGGFGSSERGRQYLSNIDKGGLFVIYYLFSDYDSSWDYSWYDPKRLDGFEDVIREYLSKSDFYTPELINSIIVVYQQQKESLNAVALKQK